MNVRQAIRDFFERELGLDLTNVQDADPLVSSGVVDSFALIELLSFLETEFDARISIAELTLDDIDTIEALASLVAGSMSA